MTPSEGEPAASRNLRVPISERPPLHGTEISRFWASLPLKINGAALAAFFVVYANAFRAGGSLELPVIPAWLFALGLLTAFNEKIAEALVDSYYDKLHQINLRLEFIARVNAQKCPTFHDQMKQNDFKIQVSEMQKDRMSKLQMLFYSKVAAINATISKYLFIMGVLYCLIWISV